MHWQLLTQKQSTAQGGHSNVAWQENAEHICLVSARTLSWSRSSVSFKNTAAQMKISDDSQFYSSPGTFSFTELQIVPKLSYLWQNTSETLWLRPVMWQKRFDLNELSDMNQNPRKNLISFQPHLEEAKCLGLPPTGICTVSHLSHFVIGLLNYPHSCC